MVLFSTGYGGKLLCDKKKLKIIKIRNLIIRSKGSCYIKHFSRYNSKKQFNKKRSKKKFNRKKILKNYLKAFKKLKILFTYYGFTKKKFPKKIIQIFFLKKQKFL